MKKLKAAILGLGMVGYEFSLDKKRKGVWSHFDAIQNNKNLTLEAVVDLRPNMCKSFETKFGINAYTNVEQMFDQHDIDFVSICTPAHVHYENILSAIKHSVKIIFCEKPICIDLKQAEKVVKLCKQKNVILGVNHNRRWETPYIKVSEFLKEGKLGDFRSSQVHYSGHVFNSGTHVIDAIMMLTGKTIARVSGISHDKSMSDPHISGLLEFEDGNLCHLVCNQLREDLIYEWEIIGSEGRIKILDNGLKTEYSFFKESRNYSGFRELSTAKKLPLGKHKDRMIAAFDNLVRAYYKKEPAVRCDGVDGFNAASVAEALKKSSLSNGKWTQVKVFK